MEMDDTRYVRAHLKSFGIGSKYPNYRTMNMFLGIEKRTILLFLGKLESVEENDGDLVVAR